MLSIRLNTLLNKNECAIKNTTKVKSSRTYPSKKLKEPKNNALSPVCNGTDDYLLERHYSQNRFRISVKYLKYFFKNYFMH